MILTSYLGGGRGVPHTEQNLPRAFVPQRPQNLACGGGGIESAAAGFGCTGFCSGFGGGGFGADVAISGMGASTRGPSMKELSRTDTSPGRLNISFFLGLCFAPQWGQMGAPAVYQ